MQKFAILFFLLAIGGLVLAPCQEPGPSAGELYAKSNDAFAARNFRQAEDYLKRIIEGGYQLPDLNRAVVHNALGLVYYETGSFSDALDHYRRAETFSSGQGDGVVRMKVNIFNNLALYYTWLGDYSLGLDYYQRAIGLLQSLPARDEAYYNQYSMLQFNMGIIFYKLGRMEEALPILKESERIKELYGQAYLASVYFNLARVYQSLDEPDLSQLYYQKSIDLWIAEYDPEYFQLANVYLQFGQLQVSQGNDEQGYGCYIKALQNYTTNYGLKHPLTADCYSQLAKYYRDRSDFPRALEFVQQALIAVSVDFNDKSFYTNPSGAFSMHDLTLIKGYAIKAEALEGLAELEVGVDQKREFLNAALETNALSIEILHRLQSSYLSRESRIYLTSRQKELFTTGIRLNIAMYNLTGEETYREQAFLTAVHSKSNELLFEMKTKEWLYLESLPEDPELSVLELKHQIDRYSNLIQVEQMELDPDSAKLTTWQAELFLTRDSFNRQMEHLASANPRIEEFGGAEGDYSMAQFRQNLRKKETLVEYFISNHDAHGTRNLFVFVVTRESCHIHQDRIDPGFQKDMETVLQNLHRFNPYRESPQQYDSLKMALYSFYKALVEPVESLLQGEDLIIVPDEELAYLPFGALIDQYEAESIINYAGLPFLIHRYDITYAYNSKLIRNGTRSNLRFPRINAWVPGDATMNSSNPTHLQGATEEVNQILMFLRGRRLPGNPGKAETEIFLEENAIIHLAMHALDGAGEGESPYLLLDAEKDSMLSNRLYDYEINAMNLSSPMVVLSSCKTGSGQLLAGEGIMSLSRTFLMAGAESVIHTLWPVEDGRGPDVMVEYYHGLKRGRSKSSALSRAKKEYLVSTPSSYTHPYYWATYQITGDPTPLLNKWRILVMCCLVLTFLTLIYLIRRSFFSRD